MLVKYADPLTHWRMDIRQQYEIKIIEYMSSNYFMQHTIQQEI